MPMLFDGEVDAVGEGDAAGAGEGEFCAEDNGSRIKAEEMRRSLTEISPVGVIVVPEAEKLLLIEVTVERRGLQKMTVVA